MNPHFLPLVTDAATPIFAVPCPKAPKSISPVSVALFNDASHEIAYRVPMNFSPVFRNAAFAVVVDFVVLFVPTTR